MTTIRIFTPHDGYFDVDEHIEGSPYRGRTRIIVTGNAMGESKGIQILRFHKYESDEVKNRSWVWAGNPYAGIYLLPDEWEMVFKAIRAAKSIQSKGDQS